MTCWLLDKWGAAMSEQLSSSKIQNNPKYHQLVKERDALSWTLSALVLILYFGFILLVAFAPGFLTQPISATSVIPVGMLVGVGVILGSVVLTGIYVYRANSTFDPLIREIIQEAAK
jgi:uncharacterized membrane protein (DUF485 family)